uniref:Uncharacterized protein n=1 Tax=Trieres chinensis TaxID=1514140 RepID=A0A7S2EKP8_TRICV|eukprot:CAMPEP_0183307710 /NCGR_PEP_ID=MMETSP0160_2-20130417/18885_1 /TAXON_ID=2839 ORGANISM="Odontella Sinensis, Strain Grunow 1884" /NCGR_SAMPLE_ID=MMETSP0160_2 /ASSEMBLY_ACC=CAM_ASM_000250 /LENGTH=266 /DNA_ID=CAMNT_0025471357 /DNA_START=77 /DNA_END=877 /DNA_ORIENTATION=-
MAMDTEEIVFRFLVLPVMVGLVSAAVGYTIQWKQEDFKKSQTNREHQMEKATEVSQTIINSCDKLFNRMKHEVWYLAWRRAVPKGNHTEELLEADKEAWKSYNETLREWRTNSICSETNLRTFFGDEYELNLFWEINTLFEGASIHLWNIYNSPKKGDVILATPGGFDTMSSIRDRDLDEKDQITSRNEFDAIFEEMGSKITTLAATMITEIETGYIGNLRGDKPPPKEVQQMMNEQKLGKHQKAHALLLRKSEQAGQIFQEVVGV